jgi:hypothetical protein
MFLPEFVAPEVGECVRPVESASELLLCEVCQTDCALLLCPACFELSLRELERQVEGEVVAGEFERQDALSMASVVC